MRSDHDPATILMRRIEKASARIVVMDLGYVGLPLAAEFAKAGFEVTGFDPNAERVAAINRGKSHVDYPTSETLSYLTTESKKLNATTDPSVLYQADVVIICVPTPLNRTREPDLSFVSNAVGLIAKHLDKTSRLTPGLLVVLESTSYPGTTREIVAEGLKSPDFELGENLFIGFSPERIDPGNKTYNLSNTPKIVAGMTPTCSRLIQRLYFTLNERVVPVSSLEVAEMAKVFENTFRAVNIALVNELALMCRELEIDPFEVIDAAATKPFGFMPFRPGPGVGGHCLPLDPIYLAWRMRSFKSQSRFIDLADNINSGMPLHVVRVLTEALNGKAKAVRGSSILVAGLTYKANVADTRESPSIEIIERLMKMGAEVSYQDPLVPSYKGFACATDPNYGSYDAVVLAVRHDVFDLNKILAAPIVVDTRGAFRDTLGKPLNDPKVYRI